MAAGRRGRSSQRRGGTDVLSPVRPVSDPCLTPKLNGGLNETCCSFVCACRRLRRGPLCADAAAGGPGTSRQDARHLRRRYRGRQGGALRLADRPDAAHRLRQPGRARPDAHPGDVERRRRHQAGLSPVDALSRRSHRRAPGAVQEDPHRQLHRSRAEHRAEGTGPELLDDLRAVPRHGQAHRGQARRPRADHRPRLEDRDVGRARC